jgi:hypothetical protein
MMYRSQKVWWIALLSNPPLTVGGTVLVYVAIVTLSHWIAAKPKSESPPVLLAIALVAMIAIGAIRYWSYHSTSYEITPNELVVRFWPFRLRYWLNSIAEVYPSSARRPRGVVWNFTTSLDYVYITFRLTNRNWTGLPIAISPAEKSNFLRELAERVPGIKVVN